MPSIELRPWRPQWREDYRKVEAELRAVLGADVMFEHDGSTAVPGMSAKPALDVLVGVAHARDIEGAAGRLSASGFRRGAAAPSAEPAAFLMRDGRGGAPAVNLHLTVPGARQWIDMVRFRDRLRSDSDLANIRQGGTLAAESERTFLMSRWVVSARWGGAADVRFQAPDRGPLLARLRRGDRGCAVALWI